MREKKTLKAIQTRARLLGSDLGKLLSDLCEIVLNPDNNPEKTAKTPRQLHHEERRKSLKAEFKKRRV